MLFKHWISYISCNKHGYCIIGYRNRWIDPMSFKCQKHLISNGLRGKRLGIMRDYPYFCFANDTKTLKKIEIHFAILSQGGAMLVENLEIVNLDHIVSMFGSEFIAILAEFKIALNAYQEELVASPV